MKFISNNSQTSPSLFQSIRHTFAESIFISITWSLTFVMQVSYVPPVDHHGQLSKKRMHLQPMVCTNVFCFFVKHQRNTFVLLSNILVTDSGNLWDSSCSILCSIRNWIYAGTFDENHRQSSNSLSRIDACSIWNPIDKNDVSAQQVKSAHRSLKRKKRNLSVSPSRLSSRLVLFQSTSLMKEENFSFASTLKHTSIGLEKKRKVTRATLTLSCTIAKTSKE